ncbi:ABC transporter permease [Terribacillus sp. JSM ZJ617]|uniref:ABC transporter permease n=1 Tax=Terribacillus sp. JSM ZJ617 TaxID=3342119 RepID=UPI0035A92C00
MKSVLWAQFLKDKRNPLLLLLFIAGSIVATLILGGGVQSLTTVAIFSEKSNASEIEEKWEALLNTNDSFKFEVVDPEKAREDVRNGNSDVAVSLSENDYELLVARKMPNVSYVEQHVASVFQQEAQIKAIESQKEGDVRNEMKDYLADAPFQLESQGVDDEQIPKFNIRTQLLFAFIFLISMFIIGFKVNNVTQDRVSGIWDRMILSPVKKSSMYTGYLLYSFLITMLQIVIVLIVFKYIMKYDLGDNLWLIILISACFTFGMISIAMLITGFVKTPEQFYAIYPALIPLVPLVSGAYMMPGTITNPVLLFIADLFPLAHAMEAIMSIVFYGAGLQEVTMSLLYMLLIGIVAMGVGINLVERRSS